MNGRKKVTAVIVTAVAITGSASALANASDSKKVSKVSVSKSTAVAKGPIANAANAMAGKVPGGPAAILDKVLGDLVSKGTITDAQSKSIADALKAAVAAAEANRPPMGDGPRGGFAPDNKDAIITATLGIDAATLHARLAAGDSLAKIAGAKTDALIAALVADETKQIDAAVAAGKLTADQATTMKANLTAHVTAEVNGTGGFMGDMGPRGPRGGHEGHGPGRGHGMGGIPGGTSGTTNGIPSTTTNPKN